MVGEVVGGGCSSHWGIGSVVVDGGGIGGYGGIRSGRGGWGPLKGGRWVEGHGAEVVGAVRVGGGGSSIGGSVFNGGGGSVGGRDDCGGWGPRGSPSDPNVSTFFWALSDNMMATPAALSSGKRFFPFRGPFFIRIGSDIRKELFFFW